MCGITGIFAFNSIGRINLVHLEEATRRLEKRGPDVHDTWFDERVGLGHRRLSIIDTSSLGNQPMSDISGRYHIVYNGEVYNYLSLRNELEREGVTFKSSSDTEVLLYAYIQWGASFLSRLNGFFALAIYDTQERSMFLARDRYGIKPLLYYHDGDKFLFASEMKSLMTYGIPKKINHQALHLYLQLTYVPPPFSMIEGVRKLEPGHSILIHNGEVSVSQYYKLPVPQQSEYSSFSEAQHALQGTLKRAVQDRLIADVPLGAFLSGGIDSSIIVALASEKVTGLKTYSIGFKDNKFFDETRYAELVANRYQTDHHVFSLTNDDLLNEVHNAVNYIDEPFADSSALPVYILSKKTREHVTVALSGDGADEIFSGYNKHSAWMMSQSDSAKVKAVQTLGWLWNALPKSRNNKITDTIRKLDRFAQLQNLGLRDRYWFLASFIPERQVSSLLKHSVTNTEKEELRDFFTDGLKTGDLNEMLAADTKMVLPGDMLTKVDLMSMANSLEVRVPFLDPDVVRLAFSLPSEMKIDGDKRKILLREAFKDYLPQELHHRPKHGFDVPLLNWLRNELKNSLNKMVFNREKIEEQGLFNWSEIAAIRRRLHSYNPGDTPIITWSLYVFQEWYYRYIGEHK